MKQTTINNSIIKGIFKVIACNAVTLDGSATYTLHVETAGGASDFGFQSIETAKAVAELLWNASTTDRIHITNDDTAEVLYLCEAASKLPF